MPVERLRGSDSTSAPPTATGPAFSLDAWIAMFVIRRAGVSRPTRGVGACAFTRSSLPETNMPLSYHVAGTRGSPVRDGPVHGGRGGVRGTVAPGTHEHRDALSPH